MKNYIVISGDFISYTSLSTAEKQELEQSIQSLFKDMEKRYNTFSRLVKGDYLETVVPDPENGLVVALIIKTFIKSLEIEEKATNTRSKVFQTYSIRLAMGLGTLDRFDRESNVIDGDAIYRSGRAISDESTHNKERIVIKNTLFFSSKEEVLNEAMETILGLLDHILARATSKQSEVIFLKLMGNSEKEIAKQLEISQSSVNQHSTASGWNAIEKSVSYFYNTLSAYK
ncbi:fumarate hydratase [Dokdonia sinensis]|uniref:Fumarate hydratase n=1 Tax=Dokdonia sinensis TaxID=2479847 RepID=A0A3M0G7F7_9FLAO|nr:fumarate hydratase [Dokdonia sinensis]RMB60951.1 fumarate hydratase [Dokdonia sinensis]